MSGLSSVINTIFGGSNSKSQSGNQSYDWTTQNFGTPGASAYGSALGSLGSVLGSSPQDFWNNGGGDFLLNQGLGALTSKYSALGLDHSGAAMKGMEDYRNGLASTFLQNYIGDLTGFGDLGAKGGALTESAGEYSKGSGSESSGGLGKFIGSLLAFA